MKQYAIFLIMIVTLLMAGCRQEDFGPKQTDTRSYAVVGFDRIEAGDGFDVTVMQGPVYSISASGDRRDLDDVNASKIGSTLALHYTSSHNRQYRVYITVTMPVIEGIDLSGGVDARVTGFTMRADRFDASLSGATVGQFQVSSDHVNIILTGASEAHFSGAGDIMDASVSGASTLYANGYPVANADLVVTGASRANVTVSNRLSATVSGASEVVYHGNPQMETEVTGGSSVRKD